MIISWHWPSCITGTLLQPVASLLFVCNVNCNINHDWTLRPKKCRSLMIRIMWGFSLRECHSVDLDMNGCASFYHLMWV